MSYSSSSSKVLALNWLFGVPVSAKFAFRNFKQLGLTKHEQAKLPLQAKYYRDLIPLTKPGKDQQYSFEVDLDR